MENSPPRRLTSNLRPSRPLPPPSSAMAILLVLSCLLLCNPTVLLTNAARVNAPAKSDSFTPQDNYLLDCGATASTTTPGKRIFLGDQETSKYLSYNGRDIQVSAPESNLNVSSPIYLSAKVFENEATYSFHVTRPGWHWVRLHFAPIPNNEKDLKIAKFKVKTSNNLVLIHEFKNAENAAWTLKEFLVNVTTERYSLTFQPAHGSVAFVNAIEFVSAPDILLNDVASAVFPKADFSGLQQMAYQTVYRLNVGGPVITAENDTLARTWDSDKAYIDPNIMGNDVSVAPSVITYPDGESPLIAPPLVYATATEMAKANVQVPNFNITWKMKIDTSFQYLIRLHFADIVSKSENDLYFNVFINGKPGIKALDLTTAAGALSAAYYSDFVVNSSMVSGLDPLTIQVGPVNENAGTKNALLNGLEVLKMNNSVGSLDGEFGVNGNKADGSNPVKGTVAAVGFAMMFGAFVGLGAIAVKWRKRPQDWQRSKSFSSWLLPIHAGDSSFMSNSKTSMGSRKSQFFSSNTGLGRYFSFDELTEATNNWDPKSIIGVGGFGNVYIGKIDDGLDVAVKRGNPQSEQGINEFQTEIQMLSKLRHRHLVSLIGYCDENAEMILVYEFMKNGPFRDHLYGKEGITPLPWKQRLEICIGAARGLHYLHTGAAQGIIHRDVKTTNILLDDNFIAKMADFGLSKDAPSGSEQNYVSTAVKGSFGYLDPEYFRKQQLTDKSDVYSFGVVLFEALCARPAINPALPREQVNLAEWAMQWKRKGLLDKIIDPTLVGDINLESMKKFAEAAEKCLAEYGVDRPTMGDVLWNLEYALQLQESSKDEGESKAVAGPVAVEVSGPDAADVEDNRPVSGPEAAGTGPAEVQEHSGTAMFQQFAALNGR
ncbi:hypothetical protein ACJIZ3_000832 [Penstemon smallii]|uniref:Protein kinase domain-containing protein n=1 Tax=Penstemon smallii TaxID=265156 RepID=A0ABD3U1U9_9LAMI